MTVSVAVILACILTGIASVVGIGIRASRRGIRPIRSWLPLPIGALLTFAFIPAVVGLAEGVWTAGDLRLWAAVGIGSAGVVGQIVGWRAVLQHAVRPGQCSACEYELGGSARCPECGWRRDPSDP